jgi:hypothetical protein
LSLGNAFPEDFRRTQIEQRLTPGAVLYLEVEFPQITKNKYLVLVACPDDNYYHFIVNSETNQYIEERPHLNVCQVTLDAQSHEFLDWDSKVACHEVLPISKREIISALLNDMDRYKGRITASAKDEIVSAVKHAITLSKVEQREIVTALETKYP